MEIWMPMSGLEGLYEISNLGRVFSLAKNNPKGYGAKHSGKYLKPYSYKGHYPVVQVGGRKEYVHRLVAIHFIPNPMNKECVNHKDGDKLNYRFDNLEWVTVKENIEDSHRKGYWKPTSKVRMAGRRAGQKSRLFSSKEVGMIKYMAKVYTPYAITKLIGVSQNVVSGILKGRTYAR